MIKILLDLEVLHCICVSGVSRDTPPRRNGTAYQPEWNFVRSYFQTVEIEPLGLVVELGSNNSGTLKQ